MERFVKRVSRRGQYRPKSVAMRPAAGRCAESDSSGKDPLRAGDQGLGEGAGGGFGLLDLHGSGSLLLEAMRTAGVEVEVEHAFEVGDLPPRFLGKGRLAFEGVQDDAFQQVAEGEVVIVGERFQDLEQALFDAHSGLNAFDGESGRDPFRGRRSRASFHGVMVHMYLNPCQAGPEAVPPERELWPLELVSSAWTDIR